MYLNHTGRLPNISTIAFQGCLSTGVWKRENPLLLDGKGAFDTISRMSQTSFSKIIAIIIPHSGGLASC